MVVTTMPPIKTIASKLRLEFNDYKFVEGEVFTWYPTEKQITHPVISSPEDIWSLLHEIAHAELDHKQFSLDIQLIDQEVAAWEHARKVLAPNFKQIISDDHIQDHLDTYRLWLHNRSRCPECDQNGLQTTQNTYNCVNCRCSWRVNDARGCALRRVKLRVLDRSS
jgi:hypothetical protein